jgi:hypothetical protein
LLLDMQGSGLPLESHNMSMKFVRMYFTLANFAFNFPG